MNMPTRITQCPPDCSCHGLDAMYEHVAFTNGGTLRERYPDVDAKLDELDQALEVEPVSVAGAIVAVNGLHPDTAKWWAELASADLDELAP